MIFVEFVGLFFVKMLICLNVWNVLIKEIVIIKNSVGESIGSVILWSWY